MIFFFQVWEDWPIHSVVAHGPCVTRKHFVLKATPVACPSSAVTGADKGTASSN